jgi:hypothetical protein
VFIGADGCWFYKLRLTTGTVLGKRFLGFQPHKTCGAFGTVDTAIVTTAPGDHQPTVYVAGADGYLYALNASNLQVKWKSVIAIPSTTVSSYFDWSSPTVANGRIYIGVADMCGTSKRAAHRVSRMTVSRKTQQGDQAPILGPDVDATALLPLAELPAQPDKPSYREPTLTYPNAEPGGCRGRGPGYP